MMQASLWSATDGGAPFFRSFIAEGWESSNLDQPALYQNTTSIVPSENIISP